MKSTKLREFQRTLAPGTALREGLDRIMQGRTGALVVLGNNAKVRQIASGGFQLDVDFTPQALRELAKMDGAIVLSRDLSRIVAAGVQLVPPATLPTAEIGTRHRSADRTAQFTGVPTVTVSASMSTISLFMDGRRTVIDAAEKVVARANQTMATLASFVERLEDLLTQFTTLELTHSVTLRDLTHVCHRLEMTRRLSSEVLYYVDILGAESRHIQLQHAELISPLDGLAGYVTQDYAHNVTPPENFNLELLHNFSTEELLSSSLVAEGLGFGHKAPLEKVVRPLGIRLLIHVGRLPAAMVPKLLEHHPLTELLQLPSHTLSAIPGVGPYRARLIRDAVERIGEAYSP